MASNALSPDSVATLMASSMPNDGTVKNEYEAVALFSHACMLAVGFRLVGLGEDHRIEPTSDGTETTALPSEWNSSSSFAFRYAHAQSSMEYLVKVNRLGSKAVIFGIGLGDDKTTSFDIPVKDFLSASSFPISKPSESADPNTISKSLKDAFISQSRISDLASLFKLNIIQKLMPGLHKEGYEDTSSSTTAGGRGEQRSASSPYNRDSPFPQHDPLRDDRLPATGPVYPPRRPVPAGDFPPPGFDDEYDVYRQPRGAYPPGFGDGRNPLSIGHDDLYPPGLGPQDPLRPSFGGGLPRPGGGGGSGGMHPSFDDPLFGGGRAGEWDDRHPPGARYDPIGPGEAPRGSGGLRRGGPGMGGMGGGMGRGGMGGGPPNPFGGFGSGDFI